MRIYITFFLLGLALISIQAHPLLPFTYNGIRPDLVLPLVLYMGTLTGVDLCGSALVLTLLGYTFAVFSGSPLGLYSLIYLLLFLPVRFLKRFFVMQKISLLVLLTAISCFFEGLVITLLFYIFHENADLWSSNRTIFWGHLLYTVMLSPVVLIVLHYIYNTLLQNNWVRLMRRLVFPYTFRGAK